MSESPKMIRSTISVLKAMLKPKQDEVNRMRKSIERLEQKLARMEADKERIHKLFQKKMAERAFKKKKPN